MRKLSWFIGGVTLLASGAYIFIYLYRWEWHRALFVAIVFVVAEIALATALVLRQLRQVQAGADRAGGPRAAAAGGPDPMVLQRLRQSPTERDHFAWLERDLSQFNVFLTMLLGGGAVLSGGAWLLDRLAHRTAGASLDKTLATRLGALGFPSQGLLANDGELIAAEAPYADDPDLRLLLGPGART